MLATMRLFEAIADGVKRRPLSIAIGNAILAVAYRHAKATLANALAAVSYAAQQADENKKYDVGGIVGQAGYQLDRWFLCRALNVQNCEDRAVRNNLWMQNARVDSLFRACRGCVSVGRWYAAHKYASQTGQPTDDR